MIKKEDKGGQFVQAWSNKRGQIYLIAAMAIIALMAGLILITNTSKKIINTRVEKLAEELGVESGKILNQGAYTGVYSWNSFTRNFSSYVREDVEIIYIVGNRTTPPIGPDVINMDTFTYDNGNKITIPSSITSYGSPVKYVINVQKYDTNYTFEIRKGENFYFIISQEINGEIYVATN